MMKINRPPIAVVAALALSAAACSAQGGARPESAGAEPAQATSGSMLESSEPANGAKLQAAPQRLVLNFATPVRLAEVTVAGADGQLMPMMVSSAGVNRRYELPLDGLDAGTYTVRWRAIDEGGATHEGSISFDVR